MIDVQVKTTDPETVAYIAMRGCFRPDSDGHGQTYRLGGSAPSGAGGDAEQRLPVDNPSWSRRRCGPVDAQGSGRSAAILRPVPDVSAAASSRSRLDFGGGRRLHRGPRRHHRRMHSQLASSSVSDHGYMVVGPPEELHTYWIRTRRLRGVLHGGPAPPGSQLAACVWTSSTCGSATRHRSSPAPRSPRSSTSRHCASSCSTAWAGWVTRRSRHRCRLPHGLAYPVKFAAKKRLGIAFQVPASEGLYRDADEGPLSRPRPPSDRMASDHHARPRKSPATLWSRRARVQQEGSRSALGHPHPDVSGGYERADHAHRAYADEMPMVEAGWGTPSPVEKGFRWPAHARDLPERPQQVGSREAQDGGVRYPVRRPASARAERGGHEAVGGLRTCPSNPPSRRQPLHRRCGILRSAGHRNGASALNRLSRVWEGGPPLITAHPHQGPPAQQRMVHGARRDDRLHILRRCTSRGSEIARHRFGDVRRDHGQVERSSGPSARSASRPRSTHAGA